MKLVPSYKCDLTPLVAGGDIHALPAPSGGRSPVEELTPREREMVTLLARGLLMKQVAAQLVGFAVRHKLL